MGDQLLIFGGQGPKLATEEAQNNPTSGPLFADGDPLLFADGDPFPHPTGDDNHDSLLIAWVYFIKLFEELLVLSFFEQEVAVDEAGEEVDLGGVEGLADEGTQAGEFGGGPVLAAHFHFGHEGAGDGVVAVGKVAPVEVVEADGSVVEAQHFPVGKVDAVGAIAWFLGTPMGKNDDRVDGQSVVAMEQGEVLEHAPIEVGVEFGLVFDVDDEVGVLASEFGLDDEVGAEGFAVGEVGEEFEGEEFDRSTIEVGRNLGEEQVDEFREEFAEDGFEEVIVAGGVVHAGDEYCGQGIGPIFSGDPQV